MKRALLALGLVALSAAGACDARAQAPVLRLGVTTTTRDSGLLDVLVPAFEAATGLEVRLVAGGTGQILRLAREGELDACLVHDRKAEEAFLAAGHGLRHEAVFESAFVLLGPPSDPAGIAGADPAEALARLARAGVPFVSRGDDSGTHRRELALWDEVGERPRWADYLESGQGMARTLILADELSAYILSDSATYRRLAEKLDLVPWVEGGERLQNPYGALVVRHPSARAEGVQRGELFVDFLTGEQGQALVAGFEVAGQRVFLLPQAPTAH